MFRANEFTLSRKDKHTVTRDGRRRVHDGSIVAADGQIALSIHKLPQMLVASEIQGSVNLCRRAPDFFANLARADDFTFRFADSHHLTQTVVIE